MIAARRPHSPPHGYCATEYVLLSPTKTVEHVAMCAPAERRVRTGNAHVLLDKQTVLAPAKPLILIHLTAAIAEQRYMT